MRLELELELEMLVLNINGEILMILIKFFLISSQLNMIIIY